MPPRMENATWCAWPSSKACGMISRNAAPSSAPIAKDTSIGIQLARKVSARAARPAESVPPATLAARIHASVMGVDDSTLGQPDERRHARPAAVAPIRKEALAFRVGTKPAAADRLQPFQLFARHGIEVEQPVAGPRRRQGMRVP